MLIIKYLPKPSLSKHSRKYHDLLKKDLPQAQRVNGRFVCPWDHLTKKGFLDILKSTIFKEEAPKLSSSKFIYSQETISVHKKNDFLEAIRSKGRMLFSWLGHSTCLVKLGGSCILTDPVWAYRVSPFENFGPARFMSPIVEVEDLPPVDVILISHSHYDHLDLSTAKRIGNRTLWIVPIGIKSILQTVGIQNCVELNWWETYAFKSCDGLSIDVTLTPVQHWSARTLFDRNVSLWGSFALKSSAGSFFFGGDTAYCSCFKTIGDVLGPFDLAAIPIGAYKPREYTRSVHCDPMEAVQIHKDLRARQSVGIHWGTYPLTDEDAIEPPLELRRAREESGLTAFDFFTLSMGQVISPGEEPTEDFAIINDDFYGLYMEQIWNRFSARVISDYREVTP